MIHDLKPYPAMKASGVPWLGEAPAKAAADTAITRRAGTRNAGKNPDRQNAGIEHECPGPTTTATAREPRGGLP